MTAGRPLAVSEVPPGASLQTQIAPDTAALPVGVANFPFLLSSPLSSAVSLTLDHRPPFISGAHAHARAPTQARDHMQSIGVGVQKDRQVRFKAGVLISYNVLLCGSREEARISVFKQASHGGWLVDIQTSSGAARSERRPNA